MGIETSREPRVLTGVRLLVQASSVIVLFAIMLYTVANVVYRVVVGTPLPAAIELVTRWWMVPLVFGGWLIAHVADEHIRVDFITERATGIFATMNQLLNRLLLMLFLVIVAWGGWLGATENRLRSEHGIDTGAPVWITRYAVPIMVAAFILFVAYEVVKIVAKLILRRDDAHSSDTDVATDSDMVDPAGRKAVPVTGSGSPGADSRTEADDDDA